MDTNQYVCELTEANYRSLAASVTEDTFIIVDFWAPWCAPCQTLGPILEHVVNSYNGQVILAKVNVDQNPNLAAQFGVQGIPAVKLIQNGQLLDEFTGAIPEEKVREWLEVYVSPEEIDDPYETAMMLFGKGHVDEACALLHTLLEEVPNHSEAKLLLAKIALDKKEIDTAKEYAKSIEITDQGYDQAQGILNRLDFLESCNTDSGKEIYQNRLQADENDLDARFAFASYLAAEEKYQEALEEFLTIVKKDKKYKEGAAKNAMVKVFSIIGQRSKLADEYRDKLEWILY